MVYVPLEIFLENQNYVKYFYALLSIFPNVKYLFIFALLNHNPKIAKIHSVPKCRIHAANELREEEREKSAAAAQNIFVTKTTCT